MTKAEQVFIELTKCSIYQDVNSFYELTREEMQEVFKLSVNNKLASLLYDFAIQKLVLDDDIRQAWYNYRNQEFVSEKIRFVKLMKVLEIADRHNIPYMIIKGIAVADAYQNPFLRTSCDSDIFVEEIYREKYSTLILEEGYEIVEDKCKGTYVTVFYDKKSGHCIELHTCIYEDYKGPQIDMLMKLELTKNSCYLDFSDIQIRTMCPEEHLIFQLFHLVKHFVLQGVTIRYLMDIALFVNKHYDEIDWNDFWNKIDTLNYTKFVNSLFQICSDLYGLKECAILKRYELSHNDVEEILLDFIYCGDREGICRKAWQLTGEMRKYLEDSNMDVKILSPFQKIKLILFPNQSELNMYYSYAKKNKLLVPVAWLHRIFHSISFHKKNKEFYNVVEFTDVVENRKNVMKKIGLK